MFLIFEENFNNLLNGNSYTLRNVQCADFKVGSIVTFKSPCKFHYKYLTVLITSFERVDNYTINFSYDIIKKSIDKKVYRRVKCIEKSSGIEYEYTWVYTTDTDKRYDLSGLYPKKGDETPIIHIAVNSVDNSVKDYVACTTEKELDKVRRYYRFDELGGL